MSKKLPLEIQRNYTIKNGDGVWDLKCIVCNQMWELKKPGKGESIHDGNMLSLLEHTATHPLPKDEEESHSLIQVAPPILEEKVLLEPAEEEGDVAPISQVTFNVAHCMPTPKNPNPYKVLVRGDVTTVSFFRDETYNKYRQVQKDGDNYNVVLYAANPKHASLVGERIIQRYITAKQEK